MGRSSALRWLAVPMLVTVLVAAGCGDDKGDDASSTTTKAPTTTVAAPKDIEIGAGLNDPDDPNVAVLAFLPAKVSVAVGTPVTWTWNGTEPHSVTFLAPGQQLPDPGSDKTLFAPSPTTGPAGPYDGTSLLNSGLVPLGPSAPAPYTVSFAKAGTYSYHCVIHPNMVGEIDVSDVGSATDVDTPAAVATRRAADQAKYLAEGRAAKAELAKAEPVTTKGSDGSTTWTVQMGRSTAHTDVLAFAPTPAGVKAGDTVTFVNDSGAPHTASFFGEGATPIQDPTSKEAETAAPGSSPQVLSSKGLFNTGLLPPNVPPGAGPALKARSFSFKVPDRGTYAYVCILHASSGMTGQIVAT